MSVVKVICHLSLAKLSCSSWSACSFLAWASPEFGFSSFTNGESALLLRERVADKGANIRAGRPRKFSLRDLVSLKTSNERVKPRFEGLAVQVLLFKFSWPNLLLLVIKEIVNATSKEFEVRSSLAAVA